MRPFLHFLQSESGGLAGAIEWLQGPDLEGAIEEALRDEQEARGLSSALSVKDLAALICSHPAMALWMRKLDDVTKERDEYKASLDAFNAALK